jgi:hypothetical protein
MTLKVYDVHFLETTVVRSMLLSSQAYQQYFSAQFDGKACYVSAYVQMEIKRSYVRNAIKFYFLLRLQTVTSIGDALSIWSNHFQGSKHKAIEQLLAQLLETHAFDATRPQDKDIVLQVLGHHILQFMAALQSQFLEWQQNSAQCFRAGISFQIDENDMAEGFKQFIDDFDDVKTCRSRCAIDQFILERHRLAVETYVQQAAELPKNSTTRGFIKIAESLKDVLAQGKTSLSCKSCEQIGDAVIALDAPRHMSLEHTDHAFDYLCPGINQPHQKHPPEIQVVYSQS